MRSRGAASVVSGLLCWLDRLPASIQCALLRGETYRLSPQTPLSLRCGSRPARPFGPLNGRCRDFPKQHGEEITLRCALMLQAFAAGGPPLLPCARRLIARAPSASVLFGHGRPGASRQRLASASLTKPVCPPRCSSGADHWPEPVIAVALSDDSQQHGRLGHGGQTGLVRDGRIGYWYTNSRFRPRGESLQRPRVSRSFIFQT